VKRAKANPDGIITARLQGAAGRHTNRDPLDVDAALAELREIAGTRTGLLGQVTGRTLGWGPGVGAAEGAAMWRHEVRAGPRPEVSRCSYRMRV
jgi:hypothetical protein